jgi:single-strand DNA-binding protein
MDLNNCTFTGRLTADAQMKTLPTGTVLVEFSIANNIGFGDNAKVLFLNVNLWGKNNVNLIKYLVKGRPVAVTGKLEQQKWVGKADGAEHSKLVLNSNELVLLNDRNAADKATTVDADEPVEYSF